MAIRTMTTNEKRQLKNDWSKQVEVLLQDMLDRHQPDDFCMATESDNPLFKTTCDYVDLRYEISQLIDCLKLQRIMNDRLMGLEAESVQEQK